MANSTAMRLKCTCSPDRPAVNRAVDGPVAGGSRCAGADLSGAKLAQSAFQGADLSGASLALGAAYLVLRGVGLLVGSTVARRASGVKAPRDLGVRLLPPGVFGVAFALNAVSVVGADASILLAAVVVGTIGAELVAVLLPPRSAGA